MAEETKIRQVNPGTFQMQEYSTNDSSLIASFELDTNFSSSTDYIEYSVYDANQVMIFPADTSTSAISTTYSVTEGNVNLMPEKELNNLGFFEGTYYVNYEFYRNRCRSNQNNRYYIKEINSDRTEIRLASNDILSSPLVSSVNEFEQYRNASTYFVDFYLNFGGEDIVIANNIKVDNGDPTEPTVLVKLYEALPAVLDTKSQCWIVESLSALMVIQPPMLVPTPTPEHSSPRMLAFIR